MRVEKAQVIVDMDNSAAEREVARLQRRIEELHEEMRKAYSADVLDKKKITALSREMAKLEKQQEKVRKGAFSYQKVLDNLSGASLNDLNKAYRRLSAEVRNLDRNTEEYQKKVRQLGALNRQIGMVRKEMKGLGDTTLQSAGAWGKLNAGALKFAGAMGAGIAAFSGFSRAAEEGLRLIEELDKGLTKVYTLLDDNQMAEYADELEKGAIDIIAKYGFAVDDVTDSLFDSISANVEVGKSIDFLNSAAQLAVGGVTTLGTAVDGMTNVMNAWKLEASEANKVAAAFFSAQKYGKTNVDQLARSIGKLAPIAAELGISYQETLAMMAELTKNGISTAEATTYLKSALSSLQKPSKEAEQVLRQFGVPIGTLEIQTKGLSYTLEKLNEMIEANPDAASKAITSTEGLTAVLALSGESLEDYHEILQQVNEDYGANSSLAKAYAKQTETIDFQLKQAKGELQSIVLGLKNDLKPVMLSVVKTLSALVHGIREVVEWGKKHKELLGKLTESYTTAILGPTKYILKLAKLRAEQKATTETTAELSAESEKQGTIFSELTDGTLLLETATKKLAGTQNEAAENSKKLQQLLTGINAELKQFKPESGMSLSAQKKELQKWYDDMKKQLQSLGADKEALAKLDQLYYAKLEKLQYDWYKKNKRTIEQRKKDEAKLQEYIEKMNIAAIANEQERTHAEIQLWYEREKQKIESSKASAETKNKALEALENELSRKLTEADKKYYDARKKAEQDLLAFLKEQNAKLAADRETILQQEEASIAAVYDKKIEEARKYAEKYPEEAAKYAEIEKQLEELKQKAIADFREKKEKEWLEKKIQIMQQYGLLSLEKQKNIELQKLDEIHAQGLMSEEEYQQARAAIIEKYNEEAAKKQAETQKKQLSDFQDSIQTQQAVVGAFSDFFASAKEKELAAAGENEKKKKEINKKYADIEFAITVAKITANTAMAVTKALGELPFPANIAVSALMAATGAVQIATANQQRQKVKGLASGGLVPVVREQDNRPYMAEYAPERRGMVTRPTILVAEEGPEYVIPSRALENPDVVRFVSALEIYRHSNALQHFSMRAAGFAEGGATKAMSFSSSQEMANITSEIRAMRAEIAQYSARIENWQKQLKVSYQSWKDVDEKMQNLRFE